MKYSFKILALVILILGIVGCEKGTVETNEKEQIPFDVEALKVEENAINEFIVTEAMRAKDLGFDIKSLLKRGKTLSKGCESIEEGDGTLRIRECLDSLAIDLTFTKKEVCEYLLSGSPFSLTYLVEVLFDHKTPIGQKEAILQFIKPYIGLNLTENCYLMKVCNNLPEAPSGGIYPCDDEGFEKACVEIAVLSGVQTEPINFQHNVYAVYNDCIDDLELIVNAPFFGGNSTASAFIYQALLNRNFSQIEANKVVNDIEAGKYSPSQMNDLYIQYVLGFTLQVNGYDVNTISQCLNALDVQITFMLTNGSLVRYEIKSQGLDTPIRNSDCL